MKKVLFIVLFLCASPFTASGAWAVDRFVSMTGTDSGSCTSAAAPCASIQYAIGKSSNSDVINVASGSYTENIYFDGKAVTVQSVSGPNVTAINGGGTDSVVIFDLAEGPGSVLSGFTIYNGAGWDGGGINILDTSPTITNCIIKMNSATGSGGGIYCSGGSPTFTGCTIKDNSATSSGGGIGLYDSNQATFTDCTITGNSSPVEGGGIIVDSSSTPTFTSCTISGNTAGGGGGIWTGSPSLTVTNCLVSGNTATAGGGGVQAVTSSPTLTNCTISGNRSVNLGAGILAMNSSSVKVVNGILWGNAAGATSNQMAGSGSTLTVAYSTVEGGWSGTENISGDPLFVDPRNASAAPTVEGDYHLRPLSPAEDQGTGDGTTYPTLPSDDFDGDARPSGSGFDMGFDEYTFNRLWLETADLGSGWRWCDWFNFFSISGDPWIYHMEHGWMYPFGTEMSSVVFWDTDMNAFWWSSDTVYPYAYRFSDGEWLWYQEGSSSPRWFVRMSDKGWESW